MPATFAVDGLGVGTAKTEFSRWGWAFRDQPVADFGIDAHVEPVHDGTPSGRLIALQIKAGPSYFSEAVPGGWMYRDSDTHLLSWLRHPLPVVLLLHNPGPGITYWAHVSPRTVEYTDAGWKMLVPAAQVLRLEASDQLTALADAAPGAGDDPVEQSCARLPPATARIIREAAQLAPDGAARLAAWLAMGRGTPRMTAESVLSAAPSWLPQGRGHFEVALASFAAEHGHPDLAAEAYTRAAGYSEQPAGVLLAHATLSAAEAGDSASARTLMSLSLNGGPPPLLLATAEAVVAHLDEPGPVPVPACLTEAAPAERAAQPACLAFLGSQAGSGGDPAAAARYFAEGCAAEPDSTPMLLRLGQALQALVIAGQSAARAEDLRRIEEAATAVLDQRRRWSGPSSPALALLISKHLLAGDFETAMRLAEPGPEGGALDQEAAADDVVILGVEAALAVRDLDRAGEFAARARSDRARAEVAALLADPDRAARPGRPGRDPH
jgi:hypothetical protein